MCRTSVRCPFALVALVLIGPASVAAREGFGFPKRTATLVCHRPPEVYLSAKTVAVLTNDQAAELLRELVQSELTAGNSRLRLDGDDSELTVLVSLQGFSFQEDWQTKTVTEYRQVGTRQEWSARKGRYITKPAYDHVPVSKNFKNVQAELSAAYEAQINGRPAHRSSVQAVWNRSYENGNDAPLRQEVESRLLEEAARKVAAQLVGSIQSVTVFVPRGSYEAFVGFAEDGQWDRYLAVMRVMPEKRRKLDESYRQYALGLAHEAMAYRGGNEAAVLDLLRRAESHYAKAMRLNPDEKLFEEPVSPVERVRGAIRCYERFREVKLAGAPVR